MIPALEPTSSMPGAGQKLVLGFSGGLDTTFCAVYLREIMGFEVHSLFVNTGGHTKKELQEIEAHAQRLKVSSHHAIDATQAYYQRIIRFLVYGNVLKNNSYPLCVSAERLIQALCIADHVQSLGAGYVAHGSTGAGNDQVRFDMVFHNQLPGIEIITPVRDLQLSREQEIEFLKEHDVQMNFEKSTYSINKGLWGTSIGGRETLKSKGRIPESAWPAQVTKTASENLILGFRYGQIHSVNGEIFTDAVEAIRKIHDIASPFGIGRDIHVGDTIIGIKGRVGFEAAAPLLIIRAHHTLEKHVLGKWQLQWKDQLALFYGNWLHEGQILDPVMRDIEAFFEQSQRHVTGTVHLQLHPHYFTVDGIDSSYDLMSSQFGSYGEMNAGFTGEDVRGFSKIFGNNSRIYHQVAEWNEQLKKEVK